MRCFLPFYSVHSVFFSKHNNVRDWHNKSRALETDISCNLSLLEVLPNSCHSLAPTNSILSHNRMRDSCEFSCATLNGRWRDFYVCKTFFFSLFVCFFLFFFSSEPWNTSLMPCLSAPLVRPSCTEGAQQAKTRASKNGCTVFDQHSWQGSPTRKGYSLKKCNSECNARMWEPRSPFRVALWNAVLFEID